jgi:hypothetical protein
MADRSRSFFVLRLLLALIGAAFGSHAYGQTYSYDFGTGTGLMNNGSTITGLSSNNFLPQPGSGEDLVYVGTGGGSITLQNPGNSALGNGSELVITAPSTTSPNKMAIYDYTASTLSQLSFSTVLSGNSGTFTVVTGNGTNFSNGTLINAGSTQAFTGLRFTLGGTTGSPTVTADYMSASTYASIGLNTTDIVTGSVLQFDIFGNNGLSAVTYNRAGTEYNLAASTFDIFLNGTLIGDDLATGRLPDGALIDSFVFQGFSSAGNVGTMAIDDLIFGAVTPVPEPATWIAGAFMLASLTFSRRLRLSLARR